ncbi:patatin-like phospholipase family protein [Thermoflavimicrobium dichotomicum]|uniref:NTE family protein n=1 Tax=Thermoflavimicrobium dichotomicum TaxID=46223 RepID=A0A1I3SSE8_9BACL|nr:patatin-like phospholipase family protein [Thermoflavimicrobium dichotomicum]SFJ61270.1 NTE family protein [Thermoflavimicrobium dichotomicum]
MKRPKIGLALGSGSARGLAHIGVLKVLKEEGIPIDYVAGTSMGSLIGVLFANGIEPEMMEKLALHLKRKHWLDLTVPGFGFILGEKVKDLVHLLTHQKNLDEFPIPTAVVATDLITGERVVFKEGSAAEAVRASISIPGIFTPVVTNNQVLVDGAVVERVPISVVREMGADIVIAVDVFPGNNTRMRIRNIFDVIMQSLEIMERRVFQDHLVSADVLIQPDVSEINPAAFTRVTECVKKGEEAARASLEQIRQLI